MAVPPGAMMRAMSTAPNQHFLHTAADDARRIAGDDYYTGCIVNHPGTRNVTLYLADAPKAVVEELDELHPGVYVIINDAPRSARAVLELSETLTARSDPRPASSLVSFGPRPRLPRGRNSKPAGTNGPGDLRCRLRLWRHTGRPDREGVQVCGQRDPRLTFAPPAHRGHGEGQPPEPRRGRSSGGGRAALRALLCRAARARRPGRDGRLRSEDGGRARERRAGDDRPRCRSDDVRALRSAGFGRLPRRFPIRPRGGQMRRS